jgi:alpha-tubulin suppressor-like RCC1 family protein
MIKDFDESIFIHTLGIVGVNELQKLRFEIAQSKDETLVEQNLFGWGNNTFGQLGLSNIQMNKNIVMPRLIPLPQSLEERVEEIVDMKCGKRHSFILTDTGSLWAAGNLKVEKTHRLKEIKKELGAEDQEEMKDESLQDEIDQKNKVISQTWDIFSKKDKRSLRKGKGHKFSGLKD